MPLERRGGRELALSGGYGTRTKAQKKAARQLARALRRLNATMKQPDLADDAKYVLPYYEFDVELWAEKVEAIASKKLDPPRRNPADRKYAAEAAAKLLVKHGLPLAITPKGKFCKLAAVLFGDPLS